MADPIETEWRSRGESYRSTISAGNSSSAWLRDAVLKPTVVRMLGDRSQHRVLDCGTGDGWLFDEVPMRDRHACDLAQPDHIRPDVRFEQADVAALPYADAHFDAVVASVVLCYCQDLAAAAREMARVTIPGGRAVVALVHPFFYRTGTVDADGEFHVSANLALPETFAIEIGNTVGPFTYHRHQPADYLNAFTDGGWRLERAEDGFIPEQRYLERFGANDTVRRSTKVPLFSFMSFQRDRRERSALD